MRINGYRCDQCKRVQECTPFSIDGIPFGWYAIKRTALPMSPTWTFCSNRCLYQWSSNRLEMKPEKGQATRATQFAGFARALVDELMKAQWSDSTLQSEQIIACRAYDLAYHVTRALLATEHTAQFVLSNELSEVPDLPALPEVSKE